MDEYEVHCYCREACPEPEADRVLIVVSDPAEAIEKAKMFRDQLHETWIRKVDA